MSIKILAFLLLIVFASSITIPLLPRQQRCTIAYSSDSTNTLKLDITFPAMNDQQKHENYLISVFNTETKLTQYDTVENGKFKKQYTLDQNAIYRICFKANTNQQTGALLIEYSAETDFLSSPSQIKVPTSLLKDSQMKQTYVILENMQRQIQLFKQKTKSKQSSEYESFQGFLDKNNKVIRISYIEIVVILVVGIYQLFMIKKFLVDKQAV